jgi:hypothetical protein
MIWEERKDGLNGSGPRRASGASFLSSLDIISFIRLMFLTNNK